MNSLPPIQIWKDTGAGADDGGGAPVFNVFIGGTVVVGVIAALLYLDVERKRHSAERDREKRYDAGDEWGSRVAGKESHKKRQTEEKQTNAALNEVAFASMAGGILDAQQMTPEDLARVNKLIAKNHPGLYSMMVGTTGTKKKSVKGAASLPDLDRMLLQLGEGNSPPKQNNLESLQFASIDQNHPRELARWFDERRVSKK